MTGEVKPSSDFANYLLKHAQNNFKENPTTLHKLANFAHNVTAPLNPFPLPFNKNNRLQAYTVSPAKFMAKHLLIGSAAGLVAGGLWLAYRRLVVVPRREDYYKQLAKANSTEMEKLRLRLVAEAKEV